MQSIDLTQFNQLDEAFQEILDKIPGRRRELHEKIADVLKEEVSIQIAQSGLKDNSGRISEWQQQYVGSGGGYAAVRATDKSTGNNSPGAITNYLENGHKIREPSGKSKKYKPRIKKVYVDGYHFYKNTKSRSESKAIAAAEEYAKEITDILEG